MKFSLTFSLFLFLSAFSYAQEVNISGQLKDLENGEINSVKTELASLKEKHPDDPAVMFLEAVLMEDAKEALPRFSLIANNYPQCKYADAALFRIYSYYYAMGNYSTAENYARQLKQAYPASAYLRYIKDKDNTAAAATAEDDRSVTADTETATPAALKKRAENDADFKYTIQAGAFLKMENALNLKKGFEQKGYTSEISLKEIAGSTFNIVTVGKYRNERDAKAALDTVNSEFKIEGRVALRGN